MSVKVQKDKIMKIYWMANSFKNGFTNFIDNIGDFIIELVYNIWTILLLIAIAYLVYRLYRYFQNRKFRK